MAIKRFERDMLKGGDLYIQQKRGDLSYPIHWHDYFEIIFYKNCNGKCLLNGEEHAITENSIFFLTPGDFHKIETDKTTRAYSINLSFSEEIIDKKFLELFSLSAKILYNPDPICDAIFKKITDIFPNNQDISKNEVYFLLNALLVEIIKNGISVGNENTYIHPIIGKGILYVLTDISKEITLLEIAQVCSVAPAYFSYIFHKQMGKTFKKWLTEIRIEHACRLLEESNQSVLEICFECGFGTASHFGKTFKQAVGMTPAEYRKSKRK